MQETPKLRVGTLEPLVQPPCGDDLPGASGEDSIVGLGDTLINLYVTPTKTGAVVWGAGPAILLPTRTNPALGSNRLGLGPAMVLYYAKDPWSAGVVLQNVWSLGGGSGINEVNEFGAQYSFSLPAAHSPTPAGTQTDTPPSKNQARRRWEGWVTSA